MTRSLAVVAIVLLAAAPRLTSAADPDSASVASRPDSLHARGVADTVTVLKPIEVHGVRPSVTDRPSSTTVRLDRSRLVRFAPSTVSDAFVTIPGVEISRAGPWATQVSMRGLTGERVAVLVDGVRLETGRGHGAQTSLVPIDRIEAVEAQPGTGSAINGSDALAGTIELSTHRPLFADQRSAALTLSARGAEPGGEQVEFGRLRWRSPNAGFEISGDMNQLGRLVTPDSTYAHSGYREQDVTARGAYRLGLLTADFEHSQHDAYDIQLPAFQTVNGTTASFPLQSRDADRLELSTPADSRRPALRLLGVQQHFQTWYDETNVTPHYVRGRQVSTSTSVQDSRIPMWSRSLQPSVTFGSARLFGEYRYETTTGPIVVDSTTVNAFGTPTYHGSSQQEAVPPARRTVWGAGASGALVQRGFRLDGGARWDRMRSTSDSTALSIVPATRVLDEHVSGELGLSRPIGPWTPYAHVSTNFRAPNIDERFAHMIVHGGLFVFGNTALVPNARAPARSGYGSPRPCTGSSATCASPRTTPRSRTSSPSSTWRWCSASRASSTATSSTRGSTATKARARSTSARCSWRWRRRCRAASTSRPASRSPISARRAPRSTCGSRCRTGSRRARSRRACAGATPPR